MSIECAHSNKTDFKGDVRVSHFSQVSTKLSNKEHLVAALKDFNLQPEVFDT